MRCRDADESLVRDTQLAGPRAGDPTSPWRSTEPRSVDVEALRQATVQAAASTSTGTQPRRPWPVGSSLPPFVLHVFPDLLGEGGEVLGLALKLRGLLRDSLPTARMAMTMSYHG